MKLKYCTRCVMPHTKPDLHIDDEGVCNACRSYERRTEIDWDERRRELLEVAGRYRSQRRLQLGLHRARLRRQGFSTYQVLKLLQLGLNPLCVTATTCDLSRDRPRQHPEHQGARRRLCRILAQPAGPRASSTASA